MTLKHPSFLLILFYLSWLQKELDIGKGSQKSNDLAPPPTEFQKQIFWLALFPFAKCDLPWHLAVFVSCVAIKRNEFPSL